MKNQNIAIMCLAFFAALSAHAYDFVPGTCTIAHCAGVADCNYAGQEKARCEQRIAQQRKELEDAKQREYLRQHQADVDAAKKIEDANKAVKDLGNP